MLCRFTSGQSFIFASYRLKIDGKVIIDGKKTNKTIFKQPKSNQTN